MAKRRRLNPRHGKFLPANVEKLLQEKSNMVGRDRVARLLEDWGREFVPDWDTHRGSLHDQLNRVRGGNAKFRDEWREIFIGFATALMESAKKPPTTSDTPANPTGSTQVVLTIPDDQIVKIAMLVSQNLVSALGRGLITTANEK